VLQQLLVTGTLAPAPVVQQPIQVETDAPVDPRSPAIETEVAVPGASAEPMPSVKLTEHLPAFSRTGQFLLPLPSVTPLEVPTEPDLLDGAGRMTQTPTDVSDAGKKEASVDSSARAPSVAPLVEPERKVATTQPTVAAAILDLLDGVEPVRMADVPVVTRGENEKERPLPESLPRDLTRTAVAEGVREYERQKTGNTKRAGERIMPAAPGVVRDEPKPKPVFTAATPAVDEPPKVIRSEGHTAVPVVDPSPESMPEEYRAAVVIEVRQSALTPAQGVPAKRESQEVTRERVLPDVQEKEVVQAKVVGPVGTVVTDGEASDNQAGRSPLPHGHTGTVSVRSDGVRVTEGGARMPESFQTLPPDTARDVVDQVVKGLALKVQGESSEVRIRLEPESLGEVVVSMRMENGKLQAQIDVSQAGVKGVLESNLGQLRQSLSTRGIEVQRLDVVFSGGSGARGSEGGHGERQRRYGGRQPLGADAVEQYQTGRLMGYNTMEMVM
jgi:flagellar hook-length control protein FliK